jgi:hypothetical protein
MHPLTVTVNCQVPAGTVEITVVVPVPLYVIPPGVRVTIQLPDEGSPLSAMLPVDNRQVGWVTVPTTGAEGVSGCALINALADAGEMQPEALVTVKV